MWVWVWEELTFSCYFYTEMMEVINIEFLLLGDNTCMGNYLIWEKLFFFFFLVEIIMEIQVYCIKIIAGNVKMSYIRLVHIYNKGHCVFFVH